jgi:hypothetical protein
MYSLQARCAIDVELKIDTNKNIAYKDNGKTSAGSVPRARRHEDSINVDLLRNMGLTVCVSSMLVPGVVEQEGSVNIAMNPGMAS